MIGKEDFAVIRALRAARRAVTGTGKESIGFRDLRQRLLPSIEAVHAGGPQTDRYVLSFQECGRMQVEVDGPIACRRVTATRGKSVAKII